MEDSLWITRKQAWILKPVNKSVELMKRTCEKMRPEILGGLGGFSGAFSLAKIKEMEEPCIIVRYRWMRNKK